MRPAELCPQCRHNWESPVKLHVPIQLPPRKAAAELRLQRVGQALHQKRAVSCPVGSLLLFLYYHPPDVPVQVHPLGIDRLHRLGPRLREEAAHGDE